jgi:glycosyltransferase involved in cell wall biosynthesis
MRLLVVMPSVGRGGCEEYALTVAAAAVQAGFELTVCVPQLRGTRSVRADFRDLGAGLRPWPVVRPDAEPVWGTFSAQLEAGHRLLARAQPAAALIVLPWTDSGLGIICSCVRLKVPAMVVFQLASAPVSVPPQQRRACVEALRSGQVWAVTSRDNARHVSASFNVSPDKLRVIYNGVLARPLPSPGMRGSARAALAREIGLPPDGRVALTVARLSPDKGHEDILRASRLCPVPGLHYVWAGTGEAGDDLLAAVRAGALEGQVHFLGYRDDVGALLAAADLFIFPTRAEGASFALLEAMAAGAGIVASDASSNPELIDPGKHGLLYPVRDAAALAGSIRWALGHGREMIVMGLAAHWRVRERFSAETMIGETLTELDGLRHRCRCK